MSNSAEERYARLIATFEEQYGGKPDLLARSPGRVDLIGEHILIIGVHDVRYVPRLDIVAVQTRRNLTVLVVRAKPEYTTKSSAMTSRS